MDAAALDPDNVSIEYAAILMMYLVYIVLSVPTILLPAVMLLLTHFIVLICILKHVFKAGKGKYLGTLKAFTTISLIFNILGIFVTLLIGVAGIFALTAAVIFYILTLVGIGAQQKFVRG